jgi:hypothetical protein
MPGFDIPREAFEASEEESLGNSPEKNPGQQEMSTEAVNQAIEAVMAPENPSMTSEAEKNKKESVVEAKEQERGLIAAFKKNPTIGKIVSSPLFVPALGFTVALVSNEISEWAHNQGEATLLSINDHLFDSVSSDFEIWLSYMNYQMADQIPRAAEFAAIMRGAQFLTIAGAGAGILKLGSSALEWIKQKKRAQNQGVDNASKTGYPEWEK